MTLPAEGVDRVFCCANLLLCRISKDRAPLLRRFRLDDNLGADSAQNSAASHDIVQDRTGKTQCGEEEEEEEEDVDVKLAVHLNLEE